MKRLPVMIICVGLLAVGCGPAGSGTLGAAPAGTAPARTAPSGTPPSGTSAPSGSVPAARGPVTSAGAASAGATSNGATSTGQQPGSGPSLAVPAPAQAGVQVWFTRQGKLFVTERTVPASAAVGRAAVGLLLAGPSAAEYAAALRSQVPAGTTLLGLRVSSGTATVDLSSAFESGASASTMPLRIAQLVYTLTQFPTVTGVRFEIDGRGVTVIGGVPAQDPQTRSMYGGYLPAITVQSPVVGQALTSPVTVSGTADVFEAVVSVRVLDQAGREIARTFTTAACGTGCRGDYSVTISYSVPRQEPGVIEVFESSARDGQPANVQQIPVTLKAG